MDERRRRRWVGLVLSLSLIVIAIGVSLRERLGLERDMVVSVVRSAAQLLLVALALQVVVDPDTPLFWSWLWVAGIVVFAAVTVAPARAAAARRAADRADVANAVTAAVALGLTFGLGIFPVDGRTVVPVAGMVVGNSMKSCVVVVTALAGLVADRRAEIEARLALGLPGIDAARPLVRRALRLAISPQIENTKALGIVFLPGAMTGLILAGVDPLDAVLVQLALMWIILGAVVVTTATTALAGTRRLFTADQRLLRLSAADARRAPQPPAAGPSPRRGARPGERTCVRGEPNARRAARPRAPRRAAARRPRRSRATTTATCPSPRDRRARPRTRGAPGRRRARPSAPARRARPAASPPRSPAAPRTRPRRRRRARRSSSETWWITSAPGSRRRSSAAPASAAPAAARPSRGSAGPRAGSPRRATGVEHRAVPGDDVLRGLDQRQQPLERRAVGAARPALADPRDLDRREVVADDEHAGPRDEDRHPLGHVALGRVQLELAAADLELARAPAAPGPGRAAAGAGARRSARRRTRAARARPRRTSRSAAPRSSPRSRARRPGTRAGRAGGPSRRAWRAAREHGQPTCSSTPGSASSSSGQHRRVDHERLGRLGPRPPGPRTTVQFVCQNADVQTQHVLVERDDPHRGAPAAPTRRRAAWPPRAAS